jgi:excisionase family DNA binding protein
MDRSPSRQEDPPHFALSVSQTAERLGVSTHTVYRLVRARRLPAARVGTCWRIDARRLEAMFPGPAGGRTSVVAKARDTWDSLATDYGVCPALLRHWNPGLTLVPGALVFVAP